MLFLGCQLVSASVGSGAVLFARKWNPRNALDNMPWKIMFGLIGITATSALLGIALLSMTQPDFGSSDIGLGQSGSAFVTDLTYLVLLSLPGAYVATLLISLISGIKRPLAFASFWILAAIPVAYAWFYMVVMYPCITRGACL